MRRRRRGLAAGALATAGTVIALQIALPHLAASRIAGRLSKAGGPRAAVSVSAMPAELLLFHRADRVTIHAGVVPPQPASNADPADAIRHVTDLTFTADAITVRQATLRAVTINKRGATFRAVATIDPRGATRLLGHAAELAGAHLTVAGAGAGPVRLEGSVRLFGTRSIAATVRAVDGGIVLAKDGALGSLLSVTLFRSDHLAIDSVRRLAAPGAVRLAVTGHFT